MEDIRISDIENIDDSNNVGEGAENSAEEEAEEEDIRRVRKRKRLMETRNRNVVHTYGKNP